MPDTGYNRKRELCTICRQEIGIKTIQVRSSTTAPDNHDHIETVGMAVHPVQCRNHGLFRPFALHKSRKQFRIERIAGLVVCQLVQEVFVSGSRWRSDDSDPLRQRWQRQFLIQCENALFLQLPDDFHPFPDHVSQRIGRIDIQHGQAIPVKFVKLDRHFHQYFQPGGKYLPGFHLKIRFQHPECFRPDGTACLCNQLAGYRVLFDKLQITMPRCCIRTHVTHLGTHPARLRECIQDNPFHPVVQLQQRKRLPLLILIILTVPHFSFPSYMLYRNREYRILTPYPDVYIDWTSDAAVRSSPCYSTTAMIAKGKLPSRQG